MVVMCLLCTFHLVVLPILGSHALSDGCLFLLPFPSAPALGGFMVEVATIATLGFPFEEAILRQVVGSTAGEARLLRLLPLGCFPFPSNALRGQVGRQHSLCSTSATFTHRPPVVLVPDDSDKLLRHQDIVPHLGTLVRRRERVPGFR